MTDYELKKQAKLTAMYLVEAIKADSELMDVMFPPKYLDIEEAADFLKMPVGTLYHKIDEIPHTKIGKRLMFSDRALVRYVERQNSQGEVVTIEPMRMVM